jgi:hypothetical protein
MKDIVAQILTLMAPVLVALFGWGMKKVADLISAKVKNEYLKGALVRLDTEVTHVVREVEQTYVQSARGADGKLTAESAKKALDTALAKLKQNLGSSWLSELSSIFGAEDLTSFLTSRIESAVNATPSTQVAASPLASRP